MVSSLCQKFPDAVTVIHLTDIGENEHVPCSRQVLVVDHLLSQLPALFRIDVICKPDPIGLQQSCPSPGNPAGSPNRNIRMKWIVLLKPCGQVATFDLVKCFVTVRRMCPGKP